MDGYHQKDFALRNAGWHVADFFAERLQHEDRREGFLDYLTAHRQGASEEREIESPDQMSKEIKRVAKLLGADLTGIPTMTNGGSTPTNIAGPPRTRRRWIYRRE